MLRLAALWICLPLLLAGCRDTPPPAAETPDTPAYTLVIHGGAGAIERDKMTPELDSAYRAALHLALNAGEAILAAGGSALDAVTEAIRIMEDDSLFNAGRGAVLTYDGTHQLDASIMDGATKKAGAVAGVSRVRYPILAARAVMEQSEHVLLSGTGADAFAEGIGLELAEPAFFQTERRRLNLQRAKAMENENRLSSRPGPESDYKYGTVGALALDQAGNLAAGTSTGGMTNKRWNRIGDAPLIGAGTYADNESCAVSCTGHGEYFIRYAVAHDVAARIRYGKADLATAAGTLIHEVLPAAGGMGGLIALNARGEWSMPFNTAGMYRGMTRPGQRMVAIYADE